MDPGADAGFGGMGGPDGISGSGDFGGDFGGGDFGGSDFSGGSSGYGDPSAMPNQSSGVTAGDVIGAILGVLTGLATGSVSAGKAVNDLVSKGIDSLTANAVVNGVSNGDMTISQAASQATGVPQNTVERIMKSDNKSLTKANPASADFWSEFVTEWQTAKDKIAANDQFRKEKLQPAFDTYQQTLQSIAEEAGKKPITIGMGDFRTSFQTRRNLQQAGVQQELANSILNSELAETDVMQPEKGNLEYLDKLLEIAQFQKQLKNRISVAKAQPDDKGSWLDAISDVVKIGGDVADIIEGIF